MSELKIDREACIGCGTCVQACGSGGLILEDGLIPKGGSTRSVYAIGGAERIIPGGPVAENAQENRKNLLRVTENCILCGLCIDACPVGALEIEKEQRRMDAGSGIWIFAEHRNGRILPVVYELLGKARELAACRGCGVTALLGGMSGMEGGPFEAEADASSCHEAAPSNTAGPMPRFPGADSVLRCRDPRLNVPDPELYAAWISALAEKEKPEILLFGATSFGRELAPAVAARLQTGLTADCTELTIDGETGLLRQTRPAFGGNLMATIICPEHRPQMATVRPGVLKAGETGAEWQDRKCENGTEDFRTVETRDPGKWIPGNRFCTEAILSPDSGKSRVEETLLPDSARSRVRFLQFFSAEDSDSLANAEIILDVGRGIGSVKNLPILRDLADRLGAKLGCSRPLVEQGWCDYSHQVGQTGSTVAPKLLICMGVSGAIQHLAGIGGAEKVIAVNSDPEAPIFARADYGLVGDCMEIAREWLKLL